jgi:hypothetical protein
MRGNFRQCTASREGFASFDIKPGCLTDAFHQRGKNAAVFLQRPQPGPWRVHQHRHVAWRVPVGPHQLMHVRNLRPGKHLAYAGVDAAVEHRKANAATLRLACPDPAGPWDSPEFF